jgi:hypothetical protein
MYNPYFTGEEDEAQKDAQGHLATNDKNGIQTMVF